jgi:hypothetical protein
MSWVVERASDWRSRTAMAHRNQQPTLLELTAVDKFEPPLEPAPPSVTPKSDPSAQKDNSSPTESALLRAVSPWASMPLHEVCAACGRQITGCGFVILDYEELGAFCDPDCGDQRFRSYLCDVSEGGTS